MGSNKFTIQGKPREDFVKSLNVPHESAEKHVSGEAVG